MTPLSQEHVAARTQMPDAPLPAADHGAHLAGASSRFLCLSFFAAAKKVSAAPHRGNANRPLTNQGKANAVGTQKQAPSRLTDQEKANAAGTQKQAPRRQTNRCLNPARLAAPPGLRRQLPKLPPILVGEIPKMPKPPPRSDLSNRPGTSQFTPHVIEPNRSYIR